MGCRPAPRGRRPTLALAGFAPARQADAGQAMAAWSGLQPTPSAGPEPLVMARPEPSVLFTARLAMGSVPLIAAGRGSGARVGRP